MVDASVSSVDLAIAQAEAAIGVLGGVSILLFPDMFARRPTIKLEDISSDSPRKGLGTKAMQALVKAANQHGCDISIELPDEDEEEPDQALPSEDELRAWYARFGFEVRESLTSRTQMVRRFEPPAPACSPSQRKAPQHDAP